MPSKPKPAKDRKPMVVWCVVNENGTTLEAHITASEARAGLLYWQRIGGDYHYRVVRFVEAPLRRKGGK